jgi:hypothetical protein
MPKRWKKREMVGANSKYAATISKALMKAKELG